MVLVDAVYVNHSGAKRLLEYFISYAVNTHEINNYFFLLDDRLKSECIDSIPQDHFITLAAKESARGAFYRQLPKSIHSIFCFANVPPPVEIKNVRVSILQHNPFFFENPGFSLLDKIIYQIKKFYIRSRNSDQYYWIVQTPRIKDILIDSLNVKGDKILIKPFFELSSKNIHKPKTADQLNFIYAADGVPQKNHIYLFKVWERLFRKYNLSPQLHLTIPWHHTHLIKRVNRLREMGINILNHGFVSPEELNVLYSQNSFLVFPSLSESFGLPLVEATQFGLKVIGSDLPFIYQVIEPSAVFNPKIIDSLCDIIISLDKGLVLKPTKIIVNNNLEELVQFINQP